MNLHFYRLMLCVPVCAGALSCTQREVQPEAGDTQEIVLFGTQEEYSGTGTRTVVGEILDNGALAINWSVEDKIGVFGSGTTTNECFTSTNTYPIRETGFKGKLTDGETLAYAYYPYSEASTDKNAIPATIPAAQEYSGTTSLAAYDFKASSKMTKLSDGSYKCNMRQLTSLLRFDITLDDIKSCLNANIDETLTPLTEDERLLSVSVSSEVALAGGYTFDLTANPIALTAGANTSGDLVVNLTETPLLNGTVTAYAVVAPGKQLDKELTIEIKTTHCSIQLTPTSLCDFEAGKFYVIPLNASVFDNNSNSLIVVDELIPDTPEDPVIEETANCYMVTTAGQHTFPATVIGNGDTGIIEGAGFHTSSTVIAPKSAKLMWQDTEGFISDVNLSEGKVTYTAKGNVGNAMIAVYSGENCTGNILWSWHIWGVGDTLPEDDEVTNQAGATFTVMDRTLGAWSKTSYYTTLYQWGRKDPFPNSSTYYVDGVAKDISKSYDVYAPTSASDATILAGVQRPDSLLNAYMANGASDWLAVNNNLLWGDNNTNSNSTWYSDGQLSNKEAGAGWTNEKTIYDPCPAGYRVANKFTFTGFVVPTNGKVDKHGLMEKGDIESWVNCIVTSFFEGTTERYIPKYENGYYFKGNSEDTKGAYYPMTGNRFPSNGTLENVGTEVYYYTSAPTKSNEGQTFLIKKYEWLSSNPSGAGNQIYMDLMDWKQKRYANPVRCVRDK